MTINKKKNSDGFTLIELLVVLVILGLLAGLVGPRLFNQLGGAKSKTAAIQIKDIEQGLEIYKLDVGSFPTSSEGLEALQTGSATGWNGPYMRSGIPLDPWNNAYMYKYPANDGGFDLYSYGADGAAGGSGEDADVHNLK